MYGNDSVVAEINSSRSFELEAMNYISAGSQTDNDPAWFRRLWVLGAQVARNEPAPAVLPAAASTPQRVAAAVNLAQWLWSTGYWTQANIAAYLNDQGQRTARGRLWSQGNLNHYLTGSEGHR